MLSVLDLFSGIGGMSRGLEATGYFRTDLFCEAAAFPVSVLRKHWPGTPIHGDITTLSIETLLWHGVEPDVVCGGFPCQDLSVAGRGVGLSGSRSGLWFEMLRVIDETKPKYAVIENVSALRGRGPDVVLGGLAAVGYDAEWHCVPAAAVGAPHRRDRIWILAYPASERREAGTGLQGRRSGETRGLESPGLGQAVAYPSGQGLPGAEQAGWPVPLITPAVLWGTATQCRWRRLEPGMGPQRVVYVSTPGAGPFMALNYAKIEARILAATSPEAIARARAERLLRDFRAHCPEITKIWADASAVYRERK